MLRSHLFKKEDGTTPPWIVHTNEGKRVGQVTDLELHLGRYDDFVHLIWHSKRQDGGGIPSGDGGRKQCRPIDAGVAGGHVPVERADAHCGKGRAYLDHQQDFKSHHQMDFPGDGS